MNNTRIYLLAITSLFVLALVPVAFLSFFALIFADAPGSGAVLMWWLLLAWFLIFTSMFQLTKAWSAYRKTESNKVNSYLILPTIVYWTPFVIHQPC